MLFHGIGLCIFLEGLDKSGFPYGNLIIILVLNSEQFLEITMLICLLFFVNDNNLFIFGLYSTTVSVSLWNEANTVQLIAEGKIYCCLGHELLPSKTQRDVD